MVVSWTVHFYFLLYLRTYDNFLISFRHLFFCFGCPLEQNNVIKLKILLVSLPRKKKKQHRNNLGNKMIIEPSSTLVNIAENAEIRLIELLATEAKSSTFESDCEQCIANAQASNLIRTIMEDEGALSSLWNVEVGSDGVSAFALLVALLDRVKEEESSSSSEESVLAMTLADNIAQIALKSDVESAKKMLGMLCFLYNLRANGTEKCHLLCHIVTIAAFSCPDVLEEEEKGELGTLLEPENISHSLEKWNVSLKEKRKLLTAVGRAMDEKGNQHEKQKFYLLLLETYNSVDVNQISKDKEAMEIAKSAAIGAIQDPITLFVEQRGMLHLSAIRALCTSSDKTQSILYDLLTIFLTGKLQDFVSFTTKNPKALSLFEISMEQSTKNIRILSLCSLAAEHNEIPYNVIASTLEIDSSQVESWVITAVASGLLVAKMDQLQQVVMVEKCVVRQFGMEQWKVLQARLNDWKRNVKTVLDGLKQTQINDVLA